MTPARGKSHPPQSPFQWKGEDKRDASPFATPFQWKGEDKRGASLFSTPFHWKGEDKRGASPFSTPFHWKGEDKRGASLFSTPFHWKGEDKRGASLFSTPFHWKGEDKRGASLFSTPFQRKGVAAQRRGDAITRGFTLIELMITLAVAAILAMIAVPSFRHILIATNLADVNNALSGDLRYARTMAVSRQVDVAVAASAGSWQNGWTVQIPSASTAAGAAAEILRRHPAVSVQYVITPAPATTVTFQPQGSLQSPAGASGTCFTIYASKGVRNTPYYLQVLPPGMLQQTSGTATVPANSNCTAPPP